MREGFPLSGLFRPLIFFMVGCLGRGRGPVLVCVGGGAGTGQDSVQIKEGRPAEVVKNVERAPNGSKKRQ